MPDPSTESVVPADPAPKEQKEQTRAAEFSVQVGKREVCEE